MKVTIKKGQTMDAIGTIYTPYPTKQDCPIQPRYASGASGRVELLPQYAEGLKDIETFSHIYLLYLFDRSGEIILARPTFLDETPHGIYASRHPCRPNNIGLSIVRLLSREGATLMVEGVDMLNETPLLDIKPYIPQYDAIPDANPGWTAQVPWRQKPEGRE